MADTVVKPTNFSELAKYIGITQLVNLQTVIFGYTLGFTGPTLVDISLDLGLCPDDDVVCSDAALVASISAIVAGFGALFAGPGSDIFGRKPLLLVNAIFFGMGYMLMWVSTGFYSIIIARAIQGWAMGVASVVVNIYIGEISPTNRRGMLGSLFNVNISLGILLAYLWGLNASVDNGWWRTMAAVMLIPAAVGAYAVYRMPESPAYLNLKGKKEEAIAANKYFNGPNAKLENTDILGAGDGVSSIFNPKYRKAVAAGCLGVTMFALSGNNAVIAWIAVVLGLAGLDTQSTSNGEIAFSAAQVFFAIVVAMDTSHRFGRRPLLITSCVGAGVSMVGMSVLVAAGNGDGTLIAMVCFIGFITLGLSSLSWPYASEVMPLPIRGQAMSLATVLFWFFTWATVEYFVVMVETFGESSVFMFYAAICFAGAGVMWRITLETKDKTEAEISMIFEGVVAAPAGSNPAAPLLAGDKNKVPAV